MRLRCRVFSFTEDYVKRHQNWWAVFIGGLDLDVMKVGVAEFPLKSSIFWKIVAGSGGCQFCSKSITSLWY